MPKKCLCIYRNFSRPGVILCTDRVSYAILEFFSQVLFIGGSTPQMLKYLEIECHIGKDDTSVPPDEDEVKFMEIDNSPLKYKCIMFVPFGAHFR